MNFPPDIFLIGAQKAGTTYLADLLNQHPQVLLANPKEPDFFTANWHRGWDWYRNCFEDNKIKNMKLLDASTSYSAAPVHLQDQEKSLHNTSPLLGVPQRIFDSIPHARFIYLMRDPVERLWSSYWHFVRNGDLYDTFEKTIESSSYLLNMSDYLQQVELYREYFDLDRFLFIKFEDLKSDPDSTLKKCFSFMEIQSESEIDLDSAGKNSSYVPGKSLSYIIYFIRNNAFVHDIHEKLWPKVPQRVKDIVRKKLSTPVPEMDSHLKNELRIKFKPMLKDLEKVTRLEFKEWY